MSLNIRPLSAELQKKAEEELNARPEGLAEDLRVIREWLKKQPHLRVRQDDQFLVNFMRGCKHSLERFKEKVDLYYTLRSSLPLIYSRWDPLLPENRRLIQSGMFLPLPKTASPDGPRVLLMRVGVQDPEWDKNRLEFVFRVQAMYLAICARDDDNIIVAGQQVVVDMQRVSMAHMLKIPHALMKKMSLVAQDANPLRQKGMHYINMNSTLEGLLNCNRKFFNEKMTNRVSQMDDGSESSLHRFPPQMFFYDHDYTKMYEHVPKAVLPEEYGGDGGPVQKVIDVWERRLIENREFLIQEMKYRSDERRRTAPLLKYGETLFGSDGSFRKLSVDF